MANEQSTKEILSGISTEDLIHELLKRPGLVCSLWDRNDILPLMENDERFDDLDDADREDVAEEFLSEIGDRLLDVLGNRGNDYTGDKFGEMADYLLRQKGRTS